MTEEKKKNQRRFEGTVVSDKMDKTVVVQVVRNLVHKKYQRKYMVTDRYKCHDEKNQYKVGDQVVFVECRPLSKDKRWRIVKKLN
ncbi:MAG: 30S ribosomal protein S17 [Candidatus Komeilibacteria bacterium CG10_big_fil_rev_8_21_14_0_10_41_13]|uniref:Small ribosomal subunit protein uS17 n=1 Tax=Candidatus Komeilibacteria bacterium CG10_big_fil_rev_8_21_14_0_10_41_13 TaxID=1974476 RepID=A0A2M6WDF1_9BACT|nr:MAG: 30S ribosomal protein S17 [Candidatus Komeilibacteria bacterium CG10_big_fil_rev_8_21_14_0_10_41_13]